MAYFNIKERKIEPRPIPPTPPYVPPIVPTPPVPGEGSTPDIPHTSFSGSVECTLYINNSDNDVINKSLTQVASYNIVLKESVDFVNPTILLEASDLTNVNYMSINNNFYYCKVTSIPGGIWQLDGVMDGLMTYRSEILGSECMVERSSSNYNKFLEDNIPVAAYEQIKTLSFSSGFSKNLQYLLITTGGASNG